ncbi:MAG: hypothetical protein JRM77_04830 [Nitrososphaerota archaeon]|jgi:hypothetical protein|nr:hypothetical protein [Nitrososphaerota archaeon]
MSESEARTKGQFWASLKRAWKDYKKAKIYGDKDAMTKAAKRIIKCQEALGVPRADFSSLGIPNKVDLF